MKIRTHTGSRIIDIVVVEIAIGIDVELVRIVVIEVVRRPGPPRTELRKTHPKGTQF